MGIRDRDYMKRPSDDDGQHGHSSPASDSSAEDLAQRFFTKYPKFLHFLGIGIAVAIVIAIIAGKLSGAGR